MTRNLDVPDEYAALYRVYEDAYEQASEGKGKVRHASEGEAYEDQIICEVARRVGLGYPLGQAVKKIYESQRLGGERGVAELLGALNYVAAAVVVMREGVDEEREEAVRDHEFLGKTLSGEQAFQVGEHVQYRIAELSEGARWLDAWYIERHPNGRGHIVKSKAEGRIAVDPDKIRKAPKADDEPEFKSGDRVQARLSDGVWRDAKVTGKEITCGELYYTVKIADFSGYYSLQAGDVRPAPKAEGCEYKKGDKVQCRVTLPPDSDRLWVDGEYVRYEKDHSPPHVVFTNATLELVSDEDIRPAPKAEGCEELVQKDAPQTPQELYQYLYDRNPATMRPSKPTGEELAEMAEEDASWRICRSTAGSSGS